MAAQMHSRDNERVKALCRLMKSSTARKSEKKFLLEGVRLCYDACISGHPIEQVLYTSEAARRYAQQLSALRAAAQETVEISEAVASKLSDTVRPQGVFALCGTAGVLRRPETAEAGRYLVLERLQDPGNVGTVLRTAAALGADGLFLTEDCADLFSPKVTRSAMGALFRLPLYACASAEQAVECLHARSVRCYAAVADEQAPPLDGSRLERAAVLIGNEGSGLTAGAVAACDGCLTIPMRQGVESLNAAVSAAIVLWEMLKLT